MWVPLDIKNPDAKDKVGYASEQDFGTTEGVSLERDTMDESATEGHFSDLERNQVFQLQQESFGSIPGFTEVSPLAQEDLTLREEQRWRFSCPLCKPRTETVSRCTSSTRFGQVMQSG